MPIRAAYNHVLNTIRQSLVTHQNVMQDPNKTLVVVVADQAHYAGLLMFPPGANVRLGIDPTQVRFLAT